MTKIAILDYGLGNTKSVFSALDKTGAAVCLTSDRDEILSADGLILPGVGAFAHGMHKLSSSKLDFMIWDFVQTGKPFLGICLGMQMLFDSSMEFGETKGLGLIPGRVLHLGDSIKVQEKIPNVSWSEIELNSSSWDNTILDGIKSGENMYFVHSYFAQPANEDDILSVSNFSGRDYCSTVKFKNIFGCQYHPEKSGSIGLRVINNFVEICRGKYA